MSSVPAPVDTSLLFDVFALDQAVGRLLDVAMRDAPLRPSEYAVYSAIFELEAATPTRIAARLGVRLTTFMDQLRDITQRGHARRLPHPSDRRSYRVTLTDDGAAAQRTANLAFERAYARFDHALLGGTGPAKAALQALRDAATQAAEPAAEATRPSGGRAG